jgi:hypothetical protein
MTVRSSQVFDHYTKRPESISAMPDKHVNSIDTNTHSVLRDMCVRITSKFRDLPTSRKENMKLDIVLKEKWQFAKNTINLQKDLDDTKSIMIQTITTPLEREKVVDEMEQKSQNLADSTALFASQVGRWSIT